MSRETKKALFYHAKPPMVSTAKLGVVKQSFFWSPGTIWPPCDKGELPNLNFLLSVVSAGQLYVRFIVLEVGGAVASWLGRSTPDRVVRVRVLAEDIVLCSWARYFTLTVPLSTQVNK